MGGKKSQAKDEVQSPKSEEPQTQEMPVEELSASQEELATIPETSPETTPEPEQTSKPELEQTPEPVTTPTLEQLHQEIQILKQLALEHSELIAHIQEALARKRKPVASNGKVQIRDKQTGQVYPSKNNTYQSLLKSGELKDLVDKGLFGDVPEKNTFGWYVLVREWPDRFEEVSPAQNTQ